VAQLIEELRYKPEGPGFDSRFVIGIFHWLNPSGSTMALRSTQPLTEMSKSEVHPRTSHEGPEGESRYSSTLSLTSALDGGGWLTLRPSRFTPGKETTYPLYRRPGGPQGRAGRLREISSPTGIRSPDPPARSESLYRLRYPSPQQKWVPGIYPDGKCGRCVGLTALPPSYADCLEILAVSTSWASKGLSRPPGLLFLNTNRVNY
jgi:hypothetical protein